jgi:hypothetical protein
MPTTVYNLATSSVTATAQNIATLTAVAKGRIIGWQMDVTTIAGAAVAQTAFEIVKTGAAGGSQQASTTNNPARQALVCAVQHAVAGAAGAVDKTMVVMSGLDIPLEVGDVLNMGERIINGTAPASGFIRAAIYVQE